MPACRLPVLLSRHANADAASCMLSCFECFTRACHRNDVLTSRQLSGSEIEQQLRFVSSSKHNASDQSEAAFVGRTLDMARLEHEQDRESMRRLPQQLDIGKAGLESQARDRRQRACLA